jgi:Na+/H+ antiporter NhaA
MRSDCDPRLFVKPSAVHDPLNEFEHWWKGPVHLILFFFGLVNAGVEFGSVGTGTWIVLAAILLGKPIGIVAATALSVAAGLHRPDPDVRQLEPHYRLAAAARRAAFGGVD